MNQAVAATLQSVSAAEFSSSVLPSFTRLPLICPYFHSSICGLIHPSVRQSVRPSVCLSIHVSINLYIHLFILHSLNLFTNHVLISHRDLCT